MLVARDLQHQHIVCVVVRRESGGISRRQIGIGMYDVIELGFDAGKDFQSDREP